VDKRALKSADMGSDRKLVLTKLRLKLPEIKKTQPTNEIQLNRDVLDDEIVKYLY
jgi:hypothetical protein